MTTRRRIRCAIYTRKSSEEGLDQNFNSLDAQREACAAFIKSQAQEGWRAIPAHFDDGGRSGGTLKRPAMQQLLEAVRARHVDVIVVYKIDRLTRSLTDFARLAELFDTHDVSFVSVTQQFNTTTSMGRLMLNVLLSFAQFEREITGERIRDKIAASKKKGIWMGGHVPLGYDAVDRTLVINRAEAKTVQTVFQLYLDQGCVRTVHAEAQRLNLQTKMRRRPCGDITGGRTLSRGHLYRILSNPLYAGRIAHKGTTYPGVHTAIINAQTWQAVQAQLANNALQHRTRTNAKAPSLLAGLLVDAAGQQFTPSHAVKAGRRYRYYIDSALIGHQQPATNPLRRIPAREIEGVVINGLADLLGSPRQLAEILGDDQIDVGQMQRLIDNARQMQTKLRAATPASSAALLKPLLCQVVLDTAQVQLHLSRTRLRIELQLAANTATSDENDIGVLSIPARIRTRGAQLKIVMENATGPVPQPPDPALLKALGRAFDWLHRLQSGQAASVTAIATAEQLTGSYVTRVLRLAFLAPDIVAAIMHGTQPVELTIERILRHGRLPLSWHAQRHQLGFPPT